MASIFGIITSFLILFALIYFSYFLITKGYEGVKKRRIRVWIEGNHPTKSFKVYKGVNAVIMGVIIMLQSILSISILIKIIQSMLSGNW